ncbi:MAG: YdeI/OmpD-associated family protein, partial [Bacteroidota bacterium]
TAFKEYCSINFFKGALLQDSEGILVKAGENTQAARQMRFTNFSEVHTHGNTLKSYVYEAIEVEKAGLKVVLKKAEEYETPDEFQKKMEQMPALKEAFHALTPGRRRGYLMHFSAAKQSKTREARIEKCIPAILSGKGLNE